MAFFDDFGKKISQAGQTTLQKTREMADIAKLNMQISDEEKKINNTYLEIGKLYMQLHAADSEEAFQGMVQSITDSENKIKEYQTQIQDIKGVERCPKCGAEVVKDSAFCSACGNAMPKKQEEVPAAEEAVTEAKCSKCGAVLEADAKFCTACGNKVE